METIMEPQVEENILQEQARLFGPWKILPDIVIALRASINGSNAPWTLERLKEVVTFLKKKKSVWHPTDDSIDACVLLMVSEAIHLGEKEINTRGW
jgi:hypothetical protein